MLSSLAYRQAAQGQDPTRTVRLLSRCLLEQQCHLADNIGNNSAKGEAEDNDEQQRRVADNSGINSCDVQRRTADTADNWDLELLVLSRVLESSAHLHHQAVVELAVELVQRQLTTQIPTGREFDYLGGKF